MSWWIIAEIHAMENHVQWRGLQDLKEQQFRLLVHDHVYNVSKMMNILYINIVELHHAVKSKKTVVIYHSLGMERNSGLDCH